MAEAQFPVPYNLLSAFAIKPKLLFSTQAAIDRGFLSLSPQISYTLARLLRVAFYKGGKSKSLVASAVLSVWKGGAQKVLVVLVVLLKVVCRGGQEDTPGQPRCAKTHPMFTSVS